MLARLWGNTYFHTLLLGIQTDTILLRENLERYVGLTFDKQSCFQEFILKICKVRQNVLFNDVLSTVLLAKNWGKKQMSIGI